MMCDVILGSREIFLLKFSPINFSHIPESILASENIEYIEVKEIRKVGITQTCIYSMIR